jgi:hypothetical protein
MRTDQWYPWQRDYSIPAEDFDAAGAEWADASSGASLYQQQVDARSCTAGSVEAGTSA